MDSNLNYKEKITAYPPKNFENLSAFRVADVTISLKSLRRATTFFNIPNKTSVLRDLSCASSMTMTLHKEGGKHYYNKQYFRLRCMHITSFISNTREQGQVNSIPIFVEVGIFQSFTEEHSICHILQNKWKRKYNVSEIPS
jgi:hypothetical protein